MDMSKELRIVFMGTPEFAVPSLKILLENNYKIPGVITAPDKPGGRGRKIRESAVKVFAKEHGIEVLQPAKLNDIQFIQDLKNLDHNLQVVVAFRMLPSQVWNLPEFGTFNLHASLLPQYRGAAPINWAIINGEKVTGISTFFLDEKIDTGKLILQEKTSIGDSETAGELHDRMMITGAGLVLKTIRLIEQGNVQPIDQYRLIHKDESLKSAPKIFREDCVINWNEPSMMIFNRIRGLSPYPAAFTRLISPEGQEHLIKIYRSEIQDKHTDSSPGNILTDSSTYLHINTKDGTLSIKELQQAGKKRMNLGDFLRGFQLDDRWKVG